MLRLAEWIIDSASAYGAGSVYSDGPCNLPERSGRRSSRPDGDR